MRRTLNFHFFWRVILSNLRFWKQIYILWVIEYAYRLASGLLMSNLLEFYYWLLDWNCSNVLRRSTVFRLSLDIALLFSQTLDFWAERKSGGLGLDLYANFDFDIVRVIPNNLLKPTLALPSNFPCLTTLLPPFYTLIIYLLPLQLQIIKYQIMNIFKITWKSNISCYMVKSPFVEY